MRLPVPGPSLRYLFVMPIEDLQKAAQKIAGFLNTLNKLGGMRLKYRISAGEVAPEAEGGDARQTINVELAGPDVPLSGRSVSSESVRASRSSASASFCGFSARRYTQASGPSTWGWSVRAAGPRHRDRPPRHISSPSASIRPADPTTATPATSDRDSLPTGATASSCLSSSSRSRAST